MLAIWITDGDACEARYSALSAALEIREAVRRFEKSHGLILPIRMGLHYGDLRIGYVGTSDRGEIRAVGDTVNTAARLEALNKLLGSHILVSEQVLEGLAVDRVRPLGEFLLAGKSRPVAVAELVPEPEGQSGLDELHDRFREALALFAGERWSEAYAAFTRLGLQFPDDGPTRFYQRTCQSYLADPALAAGRSGIQVEKPESARLFTP
jgi:adenylate cyclase